MTDIYTLEELYAITLKEVKDLQEEVKDLRIWRSEASIKIVEKKKIIEELEEENESLISYIKSFCS